MIVALIAKRNNPSVITVTGNVNSIKTGFSNTLKIARTKATIIAVHRLWTIIPGKSLASTIIAIALRSNFKTIFINSFLFFLNCPIKFTDSHFSLVSSNYYKSFHPKGHSGSFKFTLKNKTALLIRTVFKNLFNEKN